MSETKHTPGPWTMTRDGAEQRYSIYGGVPAAAGSRRVKVWAWEPGGPQYETNQTVGEIRFFTRTQPCTDVAGDYAEIEANARLIAAAPELLEALVRCEGLIAMFPGADKPDLVREILRRARAAIAKAEGRSPGASDAADDGETKP
jgi:hypothetical protein